MGFPQAPTSARSLGHLSATLFLNDMSLLPNKCALPPLRADTVHLSLWCIIPYKSPCVLSVLSLYRIYTDVLLGSSHSPASSGDHLSRQYGSTVRGGRLSPIFSSSQVHPHLPQISKQPTWNDHIHHEAHCREHPAHPKHQLVQRHRFRSTTNPPRSGQLGTSTNSRNLGRPVAPPTFLPVKARSW